MSFFAELKRRNVIRVSILYVVASWLVLQVADLLFAQLGIPGWAFRFVFALLVICFPLVVIFSWIFEITPEGIKREHQIDAESSITHITARKIDRATMVLLALTILTVIADRLIPRSATFQEPPSVSKTEVELADSKRPELTNMGLASAALGDEAAFEGHL